MPDTEPSGGTRAGTKRPKGLSEPELALKKKQRVMANRRSAATSRVKAKAFLENLKQENIDLKLQVRRLTATLSALQATSPARALSATFSSPTPSGSSAGPASAASSPASSRSASPTGSPPPMTLPASLPLPPPLAPEPAGLALGNLLPLGSFPNMDSAVASLSRVPGGQAALDSLSAACSRLDQPSLDSLSAQAFQALSAVSSESLPSESLGSNPVLADDASDSADDSGSGFRTPTPDSGAPLNPMTLFSRQGHGIPPNQSPLQVHGPAQSPPPPTQPSSSSTMLYFAMLVLWLQVLSLNPAADGPLPSSGPTASSSSGQGQGHTFLPRPPPADYWTADPGPFPAGAPFPMPRAAPTASSSTGPPPPPLTEDVPWSPAHVFAPLPAPEPGPFCYQADQDRATKAARPRTRSGSGSAGGRGWAKGRARGQVPVEGFDEWLLLPPATPGEPVPEPKASRDDDEGDEEGGEECEDRGVEGAVEGNGSGDIDELMDLADAPMAPPHWAPLSRVPSPVALAHGKADPLFAGLGLLGGPDALMAGADSLLGGGAPSPTLGSDVFLDGAPAPMRGSGRFPDPVLASGGPLDLHAGLVW